MFLYGLLLPSYSNHTPTSSERQHWRIRWVCDTRLMPVRKKKLYTRLQIALWQSLNFPSNPDHISAIDNVTRKLLGDGQRPVSVGFFFSIGHSTIVIITCIIVAVTANAVAQGVENFSEIGSLIGTSVSITFLFLIGLLNVIVLVGICRTLRRVKREGVYTELDIEAYLARKGLLGRFFWPIFKFIDRGWKMYPLGILFGLGFDTSTEIALLSITAIQGANGMPIFHIIILPFLFTAGKCEFKEKIKGFDALYGIYWNYRNVPYRYLGWYADVVCI
jgi:high-affinity nickel-transport protein